jgi:hypothetical protein
MRQCELATRMLGGSCCTSGGDCDMPWSLQSVLGPGPKGVALLVEAHDRVLSFDEVVEEIENNRPVALRILLTGGGGHFVVISGADATNRMLQIGDPDPNFGPQQRSYDVLLTSYRGTWTHSFTLKNHGG